MGQCSRVCFSSSSMWQFRQVLSSLGVIGKVQRSVSIRKWWQLPSNRNTAPARWGSRAVKNILRSQAGETWNRRNNFPCLSAWAVNRDSTSATNYFSNRRTILLAEMQDNSDKIDSTFEGKLIFLAGWTNDSTWLTQVFRQLDVLADSQSALYNRSLASLFRIRFKKSSCMWRWRNWQTTSDSINCITENWISQIVKIFSQRKNSILDIGPMTSTAKLDVLQTIASNTCLATWKGIFLLTEFIYAKTNSMRQWPLHSNTVANIQFIRRNDAEVPKLVDHGDRDTINLKTDVLSRFLVTFEDHNKRF